MLKALYEYGIQNGLSIPPGFQRKPIRAYVCLSARGDFLGIETCDNDKKGEERICPDVGSLSQSPDKCNPLAEKASIVFADEGKKTAFFREILRDGSQDIPALGVCLAALEDPDILEVICHERQEKKIKDMDRVTFKVGGEVVTESPAVRAWWSEYRKRFEKTADGDGGVPCLITGQLSSPLDTVPKVNGLQTVGGKSSGEALVCFDKAAFCSYGLKQSANSPMSEEAFAVVKDALTDLLKGSPAMYRRDARRKFEPTAPVYAGMKFVHWYDCQIDPEEDIVMNAVNPFFESDFAEDEDETGGDGETSAEEQASREMADRLRQETNADKLITGITSGERSEIGNSRYHILLLSGASGRVMVRRYESGSYETLRRNIALWEQDIALANNVGSGRLPACKLTARLIRLIKDTGGDRMMDKLKQELSGLTPAILMAILSGAPLPDAVASRALAYIRAHILSPKENERDPAMADAIACQWLKAWLSRKGGERNEEVSKMENYNKDYPNAAYHCGALVAVYVQLQSAAMRDVNASLSQRYYASASRTPTLVLGQLERMGQVYLDKLAHDGKRGIAFKYHDYLNEAYSFFGADAARQLPPALNLEQQSYFALGYRQMMTEIMADIRAGYEKNKAESKQEDA